MKILFLTLAVAAILLSSAAPSQTEAGQQCPKPKSHLPHGWTLKKLAGWWFCQELTASVAELPDQQGCDRMRISVDGTTVKSEHLDFETRQWETTYNVTITQVDPDGWPGRLQIARLFPGETTPRVGRIEMLAQTENYIIFWQCIEDRTGRSKPWILVQVESQTRHLTSGQLEAANWEVRDMGLEPADLAVVSHTCPAD